MKINLLASLFAFGAILPNAVPVLADIKYTQEMSMAGQNDGKPFSTTTIYRTKGADRTESSTSMGTFQQSSVTISSCSKKQIITLDPTLKIYYVTPINVNASGDGCGVSTPVVKGTKTGTMTSTLISFKSLGIQKVGNVNTNAYELIMRMQTAGCMGNSDMTTKQHLYMAKNILLGDGDRGCTSVTNDCGVTSTGGCNPKFIRKGNWTAYNKIMQGLSLRSLTFAKPTDATPQSEMTIKGISRAKLSPSLFTIPAGFKKLSQTDFQQEQSKAMMEKMTAGNNYGGNG